MNADIEAAGNFLTGLNPGTVEEKVGISQALSLLSIAISLGAIVEGVVESTPTKLSLKDALVENTNAMEALRVGLDNHAQRTSF